MNKNHKRSNPQKQTSNSILRRLTSHCRVKVSIPSFYLFQGSSGTGALGNSLSPVSLIGDKEVLLDPYSVGGRLDIIASVFSEYRVRGGRISYFPYSTASGVQTTVAGATTTPSYAVRDFAAMLFVDPMANNTLYTYYSLLDSGGVAGRTSQPMSLPIPKSAWLFTTSTLAYGSTSDIGFRQCSFGSLQINFRDTSTTGVYNYGDLVLSLDVEFRGPSKATSTIGTQLPLLSQSQPKSKAAAEEKKSDDFQVVPSIQPLPARSGYFR